MAHYTCGEPEWVLLDPFTPMARWLPKSEAEAQGLLTEDHLPGMTITGIDHATGTMTITDESGKEKKIDPPLITGQFTPTVPLEAACRASRDEVRQAILLERARCAKIALEYDRYRTSGHGEAIAKMIEKGE